MENPAHWTEVEKCIDKAIKDWDDDLYSGLPTIWVSLPRFIRDRLREKGLLKDVA